jgi:hypothetical protein
MRDPDFSGAARAWRIADTAKSEPAHEASIAAWLVNGPFHPLWSWWMVAVISLRDIPGVPPAHRQYPEAEYEFLVMSIDPDVGVPDLEAIERGDDWAVVKDGERHKFLSPADAVVHFHGVDDVGALAVGEECISAIVRGAASPDSDWRSWWQAAIPSTVEHVRTGGQHASEGNA